MDKEIKLSLIITAKSKEDLKLKQLLSSIDKQDFPKSMYEILVITEGDSESAKAIAIKRSKGKVIGIFASDNELVNPRFLSMAYNSIKEGQSYNCCYPIAYHYDKNDNLLNRYFSLIGCNDVLPLFLLKNDRKSVLGWFVKEGNFPTMGDNGFFIRKNIIMQSDMEYYFHIDNVFDVKEQLKIALLPPWLWHKTGGSIINYFIKRYRYGIQHAFNKHRRWHMVEKQDKKLLFLFILSSLTFIQPIIFSIRGYKKVKDIAWFIHPLICFLTVLTYGVLLIHQRVNQLFQSLYARLGGKN